MTEKDKPSPKKFGEILVEKNRYGSFNFDDLIPSEDSKDAKIVREDKKLKVKTGKGDEELPIDFLMEEFEIKDMKVVYRDAQQQQNVTLGDIDQIVKVSFDKKMENIDTEGRGFILFLEQAGIINPLQRELLIDRVIAMEESSSSLEKIKLIVLTELWIQNQLADDAILEKLLIVCDSHYKH